MKILVALHVREYAKELVRILYEQEYFEFESSALGYVEGLFHDIRTTLPQKPKRSAPIYFNRYGKNMFYVVFRKSKRTQWYVFFTIHEKNQDLIYFIRHISNNHIDAHNL